MVSREISHGRPGCPGVRPLLDGGPLAAGGVRIPKRERPVRAGGRVREFSGFPRVARLEPESHRLTADRVRPEPLVGVGREAGAANDECPVPDLTVEPGGAVASAAHLQAIERLTAGDPNRLDGRNLEHRRVRGREQEHQKPGVVDGIGGLGLTQGGDIRGRGLRVEGDPEGFRVVVLAVSAGWDGVRVVRGERTGDSEPGLAPEVRE